MIQQRVATDFCQKSCFVDNLTIVTSSFDGNLTCYGLLDMKPFKRVHLKFATRRKVSPAGLTGIAPLRGAGKFVAVSAPGSAILVNIEDSSLDYEIPCQGSVIEEGIPIPLSVPKPWFLPRWALDCEVKFVSAPEPVIASAVTSSGDGSCICCAASEGLISFNQAPSYAQVGTLKMQSSPVGGCAAGPGQFIFSQIGGHLVLVKQNHLGLWHLANTIRVGHDNIVLPRLYKGKAFYSYIKESLLEHGREFVGLLDTRYTPVAFITEEGVVVSNALDWKDIPSFESLFPAKSAIGYSFSPDGRMIAVDTQDREILLYDIYSGELLGETTLD